MKKIKEDERHSNILTLITNLVLYYVKRISDLMHLAALETKLALKTLVVIFLLIFILGTLLTSFWISLFAFIFVYLVSIHFSYLAAASIVVAINLFGLMLIGWIIYKIKNNLFFPATCHQLMDNKHERLEAEN